jgi:hypothetical protein
MKPTPDLILNHAFAKIAMEMGPALPAGYGQGSATITGVLLLMVAQEFNRAADIRVKENAAMRALFADAGASVGGALGQRLFAAAGTKDADVNVATLDRANGELKALLVELHIAAEDAGNRVLGGRILELIRKFADNRQVFLPAM